MVRFPSPKVQFFDSNGDPLNGGLVYTYAAGTTTAQATYTDNAGGTANANPVVLDSRGEANIWYDPSLSYKVVLKTSAGVTIWTVDNLSSGSTTIPWAVAGGTADALTVSYVPANTVLSDGLVLAFRAAAANATTTPTFAPDGLTAHTITRLGGLALVAGDIPGQYAECLIRYNLANTRWELLNPQAIRIPWVAAAGTADALTAAYSPTIPAVYDGLLLGFRASAVNATTTPTFSPNGLTARTITKIGGIALDAGDIPANLAECLVRYNLANTRWELLNPQGAGKVPWVVATGTADAITATYSPVISAVYDGLLLSFRALEANATTTPTFSPNGLTARTIVYEGGAALPAGAIHGQNTECLLRYNLANTRWELLNPAPRLHRGTATLASGASIDISGFPSWAQRVTLLFGEVQLTGTGCLQVVLGNTSAFETTGYRSVSVGTGTSTSSGAIVLSDIIDASLKIDGRFVMNLLNTSGNVWIGDGQSTPDLSAAMAKVSARKSLSYPLSRLRVCVGSGVATMTAGTLNTIYE